MEEDNRARPIVKKELKITSIIGKETAFAGETVKYTAHFEYIGGIDRGREMFIQWAVKLDGKPEWILILRGETIELKIRQEWQGKEIIVLARDFFGEFDENINQKTKIIKWDLPKTLIETERIEGVLEDRMSIADDMHFGLMVNSVHTHTDNFNLYNKISNNELRDELKKDLNLTDATLFERFEELVKYTSRGALQKADLELVSKMKSLKSTSVNTDKLNKPEEYSNKIINKAVFEHDKTKDFIVVVKSHTIDVISRNNGNINEIEEIKNDIKKPAFSSGNDMINGLQIAVNDTWGHRVILTEYEYDSKNKKFKGKILIRIFDHFGLDVADIEKFGTAKLVYQKLPKSVLIEMIRYIPGLQKLALELAISRLTNLAAAGFRAWFILQHYRGYRPFVTIMEKDIK